MSKFVVVGDATLAEQIQALGHETVPVPADAPFGLVMGRVTSLGEPRQVFLVCKPERLDLALTALPYVRVPVVAGAEPSSVYDGVLRVASPDASAVTEATQHASIWQPAPPAQPRPAPPQSPPQPAPPQSQPRPQPAPPAQPRPQSPPLPAAPQSQPPLPAAPQSQPPLPAAPQSQPPLPAAPAEDRSESFNYIERRARPPGKRSAPSQYAAPEPGALSTQPPAGPGGPPEPSGFMLGAGQTAAPSETGSGQPWPPAGQAPPPPPERRLEPAETSKAQFAESTYDPAFKGAPWANQVTDTKSPHGLIIAVAAAKGGAGKSTLTCWLSEALTASGVSVALVDANIGQPDIAKMTRTWGQSPGIAALAGERRFSDDELFDASLHVDGLGRVLGGPAKPLEEAPEAMLAALALATERLAAHHEFVIVDTPVGTVYEPVFGRFVLHVANILLVVTNPHEPTVQDTVMWINDMSRPPEEGGFGWPRDTTLGVLNRADPAAELDLETIRTWAPNLDILCDVPEVKGVIAAVNSGEWRCPKTAQDAVAGLAQQLCQTHPSVSDPLAQSRKGSGRVQKTKRAGLLSRLRLR